MDRKTLTVIFSVILLVGFFLPFFKFDSSSGFDIVFKSAGGGGGNNEWEKYLWLLIPVPSLLLLIGALNNEQYVFGRGFLGILPLFHSTGLLATLVAPIKLGSLMVYQARFSPLAVITAIREHAISIVAAVPSMYGMLAIASMKSKWRLQAVRS